MSERRGRRAGRSWLTAVLGVTVLLTAAPPLAAEAAFLRAGFARVDITPDEPVTMSGYESRTGLSQGIHDPLSARVVAFEAEGRRLVLVSTDVIGFYDDTSDAVRSAIVRTHGLEPSALLLAAIHTHAGPRVTLDREKGHANNVAYTEGLERKLVEAVGEALDDLQAVQIGSASGSSPVGVNRREVFYDEAGSPRTWLGRNPEGVHDTEVQVLKIEGATGRRAVLFAYATHSTSLGWENYQISGDVHGLAEQLVERYLGDGVIAPAFAGASGDIDPWFRVLPGFETRNGWTPEPVLLGTLLGEEVVHTAQTIELAPATGPVASAFETLLLPGKPRDGSETGAVIPPEPLNVSVARVGEVAFVGLGAEVLTEIGLAIKKTSPFPTTIVITHCNGAADYLPPQHLYVEGGYEVESSPFASTAAGELVRRVSGMLHQIKGTGP
jgi:neutral ceramidase